MDRGAWQPTVHGITVTKHSTVKEFAESLWTYLTLNAALNFGNAFLFCGKELFVLNPFWNNSESSCFLSFNCETCTVDP